MINLGAFGEDESVEERKAKGAARQAAAKKRLADAEAEKDASTESKGTLIGTGLGALIGAYFGNPLLGAQAGGAIGSAGGKVVSGNFGAEDVDSAVEGINNMPGGGEMVGMEGATEGQSIGDVYSSRSGKSKSGNSKLAKAKAAYQSGALSKESYEKIKEYLNED